MAVVKFSNELGSVSLELNAVLCSAQTWLVS